MCLELRRVTFKKDTARYKNRKKPIIVYKVVKCELGYLSPYNTGSNSSYMWKRGWNYSSRENPELTDNEKYWKEVNDGFHFFTNKDDAFKEVTDWKVEGYVANMCVLKCKVYPEDVVAVGRFDFEYNSLVATKCVMIGKVKRRPGDKQ